MVNENQMVFQWFSQCKLVLSIHFITNLHKPNENEMKRKWLELKWILNEK